MSNHDNKPADDGTGPLPGDDATSTPRDDASLAPRDDVPEASGSTSVPRKDATEPVEVTDDERAEAPREPSKYELDERAAKQDDDLAAPPVAADETAERKAVPPSKWAMIFLGGLAALLLAFGILSLTQDAKALHRSIMPQQVAVVSQLLEKNDGPKLSQEQLKTAQDNWVENGDVNDPSGANLAPVINQATGASGDDEVTAERIDTLVKDNEVNLTWTMDEVQSMLNRQVAMFLIGGAVAAIALIFYRQRKGWARILGMFISGLAGIMFLMQVIQGGLNIFALLLTVAGIGAFYFLMKGRLDEGPPQRMGFGNMFSPRRQRPEQ
ncbi:hypothetical protein EK0264_11960 [Epidermidibacterium keratini]|uniref:Uncharacterized protein n=1 Tax=Epidermidibacterium keratini TaxID=1891644 RepID=A0A7L4YQ60_9ACTN|nr:DMT family transporter [Epidermidibacterium keratini]QHC00929.1 hypothetical protein EK0264_11960 [Epidermidibacterium keratini]